MPAAAPIALIQDFPDRLSPMVVKELRQGLRTKTFAGTMLALHSLLAVVTLMSGGARNAEGIVSFMNFLVTTVLCAVLPLTGFSALAGEMKAGTLEMLSLTRLSAGRIVFGKWASVALVISLVAVSIVPYVVARYVFGGLELFGELTQLGMQWIFGLVAAALIVCLSTLRQFWLRAVIVGLPVFAMLFSWIGIFFVFRRLAAVGGTTTSSSTSFFTFSAGQGWTGLVFAMLLAAWLIFSLLSIAATRIAPLSENLATLKRSVHFAVFVIASVAALMGGGASSLAAMSLVIAVACIDALTERESDVASVYVPFYRRGLVGRAGAHFLAPGWHTGLLFSLLMAGLAAGAAFMAAGAEAAANVWLSACAVWLPAAMVQLTFARRFSDRLGAWVVCWLICTVVGTVLTMGFAVFTLNNQTAWPSVALPSTVPMGLATAQAGDKPRLLLIGILVSSVWPSLLLVAAIFAFRRTREARAEARAHVNGGPAA